MMREKPIWLQDAIFLFYEDMDDYPERYEEEWFRLFSCQLQEEVEIDRFKDGFTTYILYQSGRILESDPEVTGIHKSSAKNFQISFPNLNSGNKHQNDIILNKRKESTNEQQIDKIQFT